MFSNIWQSKRLSCVGLWNFTFYFSVFGFLFQCKLLFNDPCVPIVVLLKPSLAFSVQLFSKHYTFKAARSLSIQVHGAHSIAQLILDCNYCWNYLVEFNLLDCLKFFTGFKLCLWCRQLLVGAVFLLFSFSCVLTLFVVTF